MQVAVLANGIKLQMQKFLAQVFQLCMLTELPLLFFNEHLVLVITDTGLIVIPKYF